MRRLASKIAWIAGAAVALSGLALSPVGAAQVGAVLDCGTIVTEDTILGADIGPCGNEVSDPGAHAPGGHGLVIAADGVDLDLNGHTIFGLGGSLVLHQAAGVKVEGHDNVSIFGGTVQGFFHGVQLVDGRRNRVFDMRVIDNTTGNGIVLQNQANSSAVGNTVINSGGFGGISVFDGRRPEQLDDIPSARNAIVNNVVDQADNRTNTAGISVENGAGHRVINNTVTNSSGDGINLRANNPLPGGGPVLPAVTNSLVTGNLVTGNGTGAGSINTPVAGIALRRNPTTGVGADGNRIVRNRVENNADHGIFVGSGNNRIVSNHSFGNAVHDIHDANAACDANVWVNNDFATFNEPCVTG
jgi:hypothetical protein